MTDERRHDDGFGARARIGGRRASRGPLVTTGLVAALLVVAIAKPWAPTPPPAPAVPSPSALAATPVPSPIGSAAPSGPVFPVGTRTDAALVSATSEHGRWGMRAIVQSRRGVLDGPLLAERWAGADVRAPASAVPGPFDATPLDGPLTEDADVAYALGVTVPDDALPLDVRFWRTSEDRGWYRLLPVPIPGRLAADWLWRPDPSWATLDGTWPSGTYRVDILLGARIVRLETVVGGSFGPAHAVTPVVATEPISTVLDHLEPGPVAVTEYGAAPIAFVAPGAFDERTAWLAPTLGQGYVGQVLARDVSDLGLVAPATDAPSSAWLEQVSGVPAPSRVAVDSRTVASASRASVALLVRPSRGGLLPDALFRLVAQWPDGRQREWEIEVTPGPSPAVPSSPLDALGRWVVERSSGADVPIVTVAPSNGDPVVSAACQSAATITGTDPFFGVALPHAARLTRVRLLVRDVVGASDATVRYTGDPIEGLAVVAAPPGGLPAGGYDLDLGVQGDAGGWSVLQRICVGE